MPRNRHNERMRTALCPGSYDPVTLGHLDVIERVRALYDEVIVAILHNPAKAGTFSVSERIGFLESALEPAGAGRGQVRVAAFADRLVVDVAREVGAQAIVKGLRGPTDFGYELPMALMNRQLSGVETVFILGTRDSSMSPGSLIKEVARFGGDIAGLVPEPVRLALEQVYRR